MEFTSEQLEQLAEAAHDIWADGKRAEGFVYGPTTDKAAKIHACLIPYAELSETDKESDRALVRGIPAILARAGYRIKLASDEGAMMVDLTSPQSVHLQISADSKESMGQRGRHLPSPLLQHWNRCSG